MSKECLQVQNRVPGKMSEEQRWKIKLSVQNLDYSYSYYSKVETQEIEEKGRTGDTWVIYD